MNQDSKPSATLLPTEIISQSGQTHSACVIWMHGLGASAQDFIAITERYPHLMNKGVRFVFPDAPERPVTLNQGMVMPAWYDLFGLEMSAKEDTKGIQAAAQQINALIEAEEALGIPSSQIVLAGFSQGGALALYTALRYPRPLAGIVALSSYLPLSASLKSEQSQTNQNIPIYMAHGLFDPIVSLHLGEYSKTFLERLEYPIEWHTYPMEHTVLPEQIESIGDFLNKVLS